MSVSMELLDSHLAGLASALLPYRTAAARLARWGDELARLLAGGGRILVAGNGGSAAEAQHLAAELVGKLRDDRAPLSAIALCAETSSLTAIGNDYGFDEVFARQVRAHGRPDDVLLLLSTSGRSANLVRAARAGRELGMRCWAFTGPTPNPLADACTEVLAVPCPDSQVVQELHLVSAHVLCGYVDAFLPVPFNPASDAGPASAVARAAASAGAAPAHPVGPGLAGGGQVAPGLVGAGLAESGPSGVEDELVLRVPGTLRPGGPEEVP
ncbi:SIS domain-containing protein [Micromonospora sp. WMMD1102]|uniref:D-sedoheptulose-7-phosphate isomerase n=1 Tax=Micromonospora sp. WMMD1102 TaxID=3016105 RepID=UPI0024152AED|nr:SIS domain-containing protein [Micromonospora sp. WMMD1102]MDG4788353.1 SIS domain-containing protein [Micromonospora sp. WMMD1102]